MYVTAGYYTGSIYSSKILLKDGMFPGEKTKDSTVIVIKTHKGGVPSECAKINIISKLSIHSGGPYVSSVCDER